MATLEKIFKLSFIWLWLIGSCLATTITTQWGDLAASVAASIESYAKSHNGALPPDLDSLYSGSIKATLEEQLGGPLSEKIIYLRETRPALEGASDSELIASISFPINEDRRGSVGRYIIYKKSNGDVGSKWASEEVIQTSVAKANVALPEAAIYNEKPLRVLDPDYAARLVEDAVKKHGLSLREATDKAEQHVQDVLSGRAKEAKNWADVAANRPVTKAPSSAITPTQVMPPPSTPRPAVTDAPAATVAAKESPSPSFPIVPVAIIVLVIVGVIVFLLRRKSP